MVKSRALRLALVSLLAAPVACHAIAGVEDKELDPKYAAGGSAGSAGSTGGADSGPDSAGAGPTAARPPKRPAGWRGPSGKGVSRWFAARRIFIGSIDPASPPGQPAKDEQAWRKIGHDLDGKCTTLQQSTADNSAVCKKPAGAPDDSLEDGELCRDNAGGRLVALGLQVLSEDFELNLHKKLEAGQSATFVLELSDLDDGPDDAYAPGALYVSAPVASPPLWNGSDELPIDRASVVPANADGGSPEGGAADAGTDADVSAPSGGVPASRYPFPDGYVAGNVWVSGDFNQLAAALPLFVFDRITPVDAAAVNLEVQLDSAHDAVLGSTLSAVAAKQALDAQFQPIAYEMVACNSVAAALLMGQYVLPAMDLANAPTEFVSQAEKCSALSLGFGLDWVLIKQPQLVVDVPPAPSQCGDGGA